jgi:hypothetical protein
MRDVYAAQFKLAAENGFDSAQTRIIGWCLDRYPGVEPGSASLDFATQLTDTDSVEWLTDESDTTGERAWSMTFRHRDSDDETLGWRSLAQLTESSGSVRFTFRLSQESLEARVRPALEVPGRPRIVRDLAGDLAGEADGRRLIASPWQVWSDDVADFVNLLEDPTRRLPVVVTSIAAETGRPCTDALTLASQLIGIAHVVSIMASQATYELTDRLGRSLSVYDGAVRIYWPGLTASADPYVHRLWLGRTVELIDERARFRDRPSGFSRHLLGLIADVAALRIPPDPLARALRRESETRRRAAEREHWARLADGQRTIEAFMEDFDRQTRRIDDLETANELLELEKAQLEDDVARLTRNFADVRAAVALERGDAGVVSAPATIREALEDVAAAHDDALVVLEEAYESASETRYPQVDRAAAALRAIGDVAQRWHDNALGMNFETAFAEQGFDLRTVSAITQGRHHKEYSRTYEGHRIMLSPHLALGDGGSTDTIFRAYWHLDETNRRFVLGHVGRHLGDSTT